MKQEKSETKKRRGPDELQREIWQYRRIWLTAIVLLIAGRLLLPHLRNLHGWEQKFTLAAVEIGKANIPTDAIRVTNADEAAAALKPEFQLNPHTLQMEGAVIVAVWKCNVLGEKGSCLRYYAKGQPITMAIILQPKNKQEIHDPFAKSGWSGYLVIHKGVAIVMVSVLDADELKSMWPFVKELPQTGNPKS